MTGEEWTAKVNAEALASAAAGEDWRAVLATPRPDWFAAERLAGGAHRRLHRRHRFVAADRGACGRGLRRAEPATDGPWCPACEDNFLEVPC